MLFETGNRDKEVNKSRNITPQVPQQIFIWLPSMGPPDNKYTNFLQKFYKVFVLADKRSSTGNLFFTDQFDNHPWEAPPELQPPGHKAGAWPPQRRRNLSSLSSQQADQAGTKEEREADRDPAATLQAMAGEQDARGMWNLVHSTASLFELKELVKQIVQNVVISAMLAIITSSQPVTPLLNAVLPHTKDYKVIKCKNI